MLDAVRPGPASIVALGCTEEAGADTTTAGASPPRPQPVPIHNAQP